MGVHSPPPPPPLSPPPVSFPPATTVLRSSQRDHGLGATACLSHVAMKEEDLSVISMRGRRKTRFTRHNILVNVNGETMRLDWITKTTKQATPLFVHLLMITSVGLYACFGAWCMQKIEAPSVTDSENHTMVRRHVFAPTNSSWTPSSNSPSSSALLPAGPLSARHRRRRRGDEKEKITLDSIHSRRKRRAAVEISRSRKCVVDALKKMMTSSGECSSVELDGAIAAELDKCYRIDVDRDAHTKDVTFLNSAEVVESVTDEKDDAQPWTFIESLLFTFTVITTIGYGNVAPRTFSGRLFVIFYGFIGIPFTLLAIADLGKFLSEIMINTTKAARRMKKRAINLWQNRGRFRTGFDFTKLSARSAMNGAAGGAFLQQNTSARKSSATEEIISIEEGTSTSREQTSESGIDGEGKECNHNEEEEEELDDGQAFSLFVLFIAYIGIGAVILSQYEPDLDFFKAVYFNFVTLTSIGLGDIVPRSEPYMIFTIMYIAVGLALTTIAIEIAADTLKRLHYFGRKIENVANVPIWFGGKKLTMKALVRNLGDQFNLPTTVVKDLNLDTFVENAIKVEAGEMETLRPPPFNPEPEVEYADDTEAIENAWVADPTPSPSPPPRTPTPEPPPKEPTPPPRTPTPEPEPEPEPTPTPPREPTPPPPPREPTPPPREPTPEPVREPTPPPPPREPTPEPEPEPEPVKEDEPLIPEKPRKMTAAELEAQKRKAYSEEAWRRYQEYQKQWKKFRATQKGQGGSAGGTPRKESAAGSGEGGSGDAEEGPSSRRSSAASRTPGQSRSPSATPTSGLSRASSRQALAGTSTSATVHASPVGRGGRGATAAGATRSRPSSRTGTPPRGTSRTPSRGAAGGHPTTFMP